VRFWDWTPPALSLAAVAACIAVSPLAHAAETVTAIETFSEWSLYADSKTPHQFCFVASQPKSSEPNGATRDAPRLYISAWPKEGVKAEVSFRMGFPVKSASEPVVNVGDTQFKLFATDDRIYIKDATQELKLVEAMKKGAELKANALSERGTEIVDTYSLSGLGQALAKLQSQCF
jgi:Invasion associated locus B (IalB) protein